nr:MAG TPA: hypothetical protein [Caudoviricetes sp.]
MIIRGLCEFIVLDFRGQKFILEQTRKWKKCE